MLRRTLLAGAEVAKTKPKKITHTKLNTLTRRETREEGLRDFLPEKPLVPYGWGLTHIPGSNCFTLVKDVEIRNCGVETLQAIALMERKEYESTYRMDSGERNEQEYLNFTLFINKKRYPKGGLEFGLTSIDMELVMDSLAIHKSEEEFENAKVATSSPLGANGTNEMYRMFKDARYRGPMIGELDEDFSDEILDYLDERGINNAFAEFMMSQAYFYEQNEYLNWLHLLQRFSN